MCTVDLQFWIGNRLLSVNILILKIIGIGYILIMKTVWVLLEFERQYSN